MAHESSEAEKKHETEYYTEAWKFLMIGAE